MSFRVPLPNDLDERSEQLAALFARDHDWPDDLARRVAAHCVEAYRRGAEDHTTGVDAGWLLLRLAELREELLPRTAMRLVRSAYYAAMPTSMN